MEVEIFPTPSDTERAVIVAALELELADSQRGELPLDDADDLTA